MRGVGWVLSACACLPGTAEAGPWAQAKDGWYARAQASSEEIDGADAHRADFYAEYGAFARTTFIAKYEKLDFSNSSAFDRSAYRATVRHQFLSRGGWAAGLEAGPVYGNAVGSIFACNNWGGEARISAGYSGTRDGLPFYVFSDAILIRHEDDCQRERFELGYGSISGRAFCLSQQLWLEQGNQTADSAKFESRIGYHFSLADVSIGYREEMAGAFEERAVLISLTARK